MQTSKIIEIDGVFIGAAISLPDDQGWLFRAADHRADLADGCTAPTLHETLQLARRAFFLSKSRQHVPMVIEKPVAVGTAL